jgi:cytochrome P450
MVDIREASSALRPHGPSGSRSLRYWAQLLRDPLAGYCALQSDYGDAVRLPFTPNHAFFLLSRPEHAEHVLVQHQDRYVKAFTYRPLKAFLGDGLLTSEGTTWQRHRRLVQPIFSHRHVQSFGPAIVAASKERAARWVPGINLDLATEMRTLTMDVVGRVLFGINLAAEAEGVGKAVSRLQGAAIAASLLPGVLSPQRVRSLVTHVVPSAGRASTTLESLVTRIIDARISAPHPEPTDLLDLLLAAGEGEQPLSREDIRDEVMTLVLAGHETTANTLTWALILLSRFPAARDRLAVELEDVLGDRDPAAADVEALMWTQAVVSEAMRLYPPAWTIERDAVVADNIAGVQISPGDTVAISPYLLHRNAEFWPNPEGFDPRRFLPDAAARRTRYAFLPFGGGRRICVGAGLAQLEATLALATLARSARVDLLPGVSVSARAAITLHPRGPVPVRIGTPVVARRDPPMVDGSSMHPTQEEVGHG